MRSRIVPALVALAVVAGACGSDDDAGDADTAEDTVAVAEDTAGDTATDTGDDAAPPDDTAGSGETDDGASEEPDDGAADDGAADDDASSDDAAAPGGGAGTATLTLDNGETYEFSVLCSLEPQMAAGSEILFTATSYDDPALDITQFGDEGTVTGVGSVSVYDADFETLWEASTFFEAFGGGLELTLDGSTIRGSGTFYPEADPAAGDGVPGEVVANC